MTERIWHKQNSLWSLPNVKMYYKIIASHGNVKGLSLGWPKSSSDEFNSSLNMSMLTHNKGPHQALINCVVCRPRIGPYPWSMCYNSLCPHFDVFLVATDLFLLMVHKFNRFPTILISFLKLIMMGNILEPSCGYLRNNESKTQYFSQLLTWLERHSMISRSY